MIDAYGDEMLDDLFKEKIGSHSIRELSRTSAERRAGSVGFAETMVLFYNSRMKFGLSMRKLYKNKRPSNRSCIEIEELDESLEEKDQLTINEYSDSFDYEEYEE